MHLDRTAEREPVGGGRPAARRATAAYRENIGRKARRPTNSRRHPGARNAVARPGSTRTRGCGTLLTSRLPRPRRDTGSGLPVRQVQHGIPGTKRPS